MRREGIRSLSDAFDYYTDCAIASYEMAMCRKTASQSDRKRLRSIASGMLESFKLYGGTASALEERLKAADLAKP
jgi:hypothetical protein